MTGRPVSTGSVADAEGGVRAYLHIQRLRRLAERVGGKDGQLLTSAAEAMQLLARRNQKLGRTVGARMSRRRINERGASFGPREAAEGIAELANDAPVIAYVGRDPRRVRVILATGRMPRGAKRIGQYDETTDYRQIVGDLAGKWERAAA